MNHRRAAQQSKIKAAYRYDGEKQFLALYGLTENICLLQVKELDNPDDPAFAQIDSTRCLGYRDWLPVEESMFTRFLNAVESVKKTIKGKNRKPEINRRE